MSLPAFRTQPAAVSRVLLRTAVDESRVALLLLRETIALKGGCRAGLPGGGIPRASQRSVLQHRHDLRFARLLFSFTGARLLFYDSQNWPLPELAGKCRNDGNLSARAWFQRNGDR